MPRTNNTGLNDQIALSGRGVLGYALSASDPDVWAKLTLAQQTWVSETLSHANVLEGMCEPWIPAINHAAMCFQVWWNRKTETSSIMKLRTDGVFDQATLDALIILANHNPREFPKPYPFTEQKKLSTGAMVGIVGGAAALGGVVYLVTRKRR